MQSIRESSLDEYVTWYLRRDAQKKGQVDPLPQDTEEQFRIMSEQHNGKMRCWFTQGARWHIVLLDYADFTNLIFLESHWTKEEGLIIPDGSPNYRLLQRVARNAITGNYIDSPSARRHKTYYDDLRSGHLHLQQDSRIAICSAEINERTRNPDGRYYILDGVGRSLPYMMLITQNELEYEPVEAFLAEAP